MPGRLVRISVISGDEAMLVHCQIVREKTALGLVPHKEKRPLQGNIPLRAVQAIPHPKPREIGFTEKLLHQGVVEDFDFWGGATTLSWYTLSPRKRSRLWMR